MLLEAPNNPPAIQKTSSQKPKVVTTKAGMKALKALAESTAEEPAAVAPPPPPAATQTRTRGRARANTNGPINPKFPIQQTAASTANEQPSLKTNIGDPLPIPRGTADQIKMFNQINVKRDKGNRGIPPPPKRSIYDPQPEAQKLVFDDDEELVETESGDEHAKKSKQGGRKRSRDEIEGNDSFSLEVIPEDPQRKKRTRVNPAPTQVAPPAKKKAPAAARPVASAASKLVKAGRRQLPAEVVPRSARQPSQEMQQLVPLRNRTVSAEPAPRGSVPPRDLARRQSHDDILDELHGEGEMTGERIRYIAATNRQRAIGKGVQVRNSWSEAEEKKLVEMVGLYGCRWALIVQEAYEWFGERGQVALKDKARNMKFALLK